MQVSAAASSTGAAGAAATKTSAMGKDEFLKLLVTQLRYQDPMRPMEDKEFIAQLAQFSALEQMQNLASASRLGSGLGLLGRKVTASVDGVELSGVATSVRLHGNKAIVRLGSGAEVDMERIVRVDQ